MGTMTYRPAIDGLRAIAVLAVVAYHAGLSIPAGFVGVDVFFVISGYLITRILHDEVLATGRIDFLSFYARRARRILPALAAVVVATLALSAALLPETELRQTTSAAAAAFGFSANIYFALAPSGYFDGDAQSNPLLHLWSLGVEEQFYLLWPLALLWAKRRPLLVLAAITVASFAVAEWLLLTGHEKAAFYQTPARAWELAIGGLIAVRRPQVSAWVGHVGLVLVLLSCAIPIAHFPGLGALPAVLGSAMVITAAACGHTLRLLEAKPVVYVGLISYSLYLWHWPIMVLGEGMPAWSLIAASTLAAAGSYRFIEQPFRHRWVRPSKATVAGAIVALGSLAGISVAMTRDGNSDVLEWSTYSKLVPIYPMGCDDWHRSATVKPCVFGDEDAANTAVLVGDSVVMQWFPAVQKIYSQPGWRLVVLTKSSCPMVDAPFVYERIGKEFENCALWRKGVIEWIAKARPQVVMLGSANSYGFTRLQWLQGTRKVLLPISKSADRVVMIRSTPLLSPTGSGRFDDVHRWELAAAHGLETVTPLDMNSAVCPRGRCSIGPESFRDQRHISPLFAHALSEEFAKRSGLLEAR